MRHLFGVAVVLMAATASFAQDEAATTTPGEAATVEQLVADAYARTQAAKTVADFNEIIQLCDSIEKSPQTSGQLTAYARQLRSWALNRRGEVTSDQAAEAREQGDTAKAEQLDRAALQDFQAAVENDPTRWKAIHNRGVNHAMKGDFEAAVRDFSRVIELRPSYANAWFNRGEVRYELGQFREAVQDYTQALRHSPEDSGAYTSRAHAYFQLREGQRALSDYSKAIELSPDDAACYANRADCYQSLGLWESAAMDYRRAIQLDDQLGRAYQGAAWLMATCPAAQFRDASLAIKSAERAISLDGDEDNQNLDTLAAAYASAGEFAKALETIDKALAGATSEQRARLQSRRQLYEAGQPFRQPAAGSSSGRAGR